MDQTSNPRINPERRFAIDQDMTISTQSTLSAPIAVCDTATEPVSHNVQNYMKHFDDVEISEEDAAALIHMLIDIMKAFVDCGFQIDPVQCVLDGNIKDLSGGSTDTLPSSNQSNNNT